jgi:hypothetical protein
MGIIVPSKGFLFPVRYRLILLNSNTFFRKEKAMNTKNFPRILLSMAIALMCFSGFDLLQAQNDPSKEILVYFSSGVERAQKSLPGSVKSEAVQRILSRLRIDTDKIISAFPDFNEADTLKVTPDGRIIGMPNMAKIFRIRIPDAVTRILVIDSLKKLPNVLFAEPNGIAVPQIIPNDQYFSFQWALQAGGGIGKINAPEAWNIYTGSSNNIIGIIDWGIDATHPDLNGKVFGEAPSSVYHGTHVAGIAAANTNNSTGVVGVNWNALLLSKNIESSDDVGIFQKIVDAINYSSNVNVVNNSWTLIYPDYSPRYSITVRMAFAYVYNQNRVAVCANGNYQQLYPNQTYYPAGYGQGIIAVGSTDESDIIANSSQVNNGIDVSAPGVSIYSTYRNPDYQYLSGTSMAAPHVSGIISLLKGYNSMLYNDDIEQIIRLAVDDKGTSGWDQFYGTGRVNAKKALDFLRSPYALEHKSSSGGSTYSSTSKYNAFLFGVTGLPDNLYKVIRYDVRKSVNLTPTYLNTMVWGRGVGTNGLSPENPNYGMGYCDVISYTNSTATLRTFVYQVWTINDTYIGYFPATPANVSYNYTVLGQIPPPLTVTIEGPEYLAYKERGTWTANVQGGYPPCTYQWYKKLDGSSTWTTLGTAQTQQGVMGTVGFTLKVVVTDNNSNQVEDTHHVAYGTPKPVAAGEEKIPALYYLDQSYPNPFNNETKIRFGLPQDGHVKMDVYNIKGQRVGIIIDQSLSAGNYEIHFNSGDLPSGIYFYRITASEFSDVKRLVLIK